MLTYIKTLLSKTSGCGSEPGIHVMLFLACHLLLTAEQRLLRARHRGPGASSQSSPQPAMQVYRGVFPCTAQLLSCAVRKRRILSSVWKVLSIGIWLLLSEKGAGLSLAFMLHSYSWVLSTQLSSHIHYCSHPHCQVIPSQEHGRANVFWVIQKLKRSIMK